ncbi:MAG: S-methyl-5'-thioadenosine phosphorylase [bacterium]
MKYSNIDIFIIAGSNAHTLKDKWGEIKDEFIYPTPFGNSHRIRVYELEGKPFGLLFRHGVEGYDITAPYVNYRANIYAVKKLGCKRIIAWTGPGAISEKYEIGDIVIPHDVIDFTKKREYTFFQNKGLGFIRANPCFCPSVREEIRNSCEKLGIKYHSNGVYICTEGPRLETAAEIKMFKMLGADMVGMTLVPEVFLARELEICYAAICYITNYAESEEHAYKEGELFEGTLPEDKKPLVEKAIAAFPEIIRDVLKNEDRENCLCKKSMLRYKKSGKISGDFENWIR